MDLDQKTAQKILDKNSHGKVISISRETLGITGSVYNINNKYIIKIAGSSGQDKFRVERNATMCEILQKHGINCPEVIALDISKEVIEHKYLIMTKLEGDNLVDVWEKLPVDIQQLIAREYGQIMARIHQIKMKKFGDVLNNEQQFDSWHDFITGRFKMHLNYLATNAIVSSKTLAMVHDLLKDNDELLHVKDGPVLVHADFQSKNIKYHQGKINGIFDFDECLGGHNEFDFTKIFLPYTIDYAFKEMIVESYKEIGSLSSSFPKRVKLYSLGFLLNVLWFSHSNNLITIALKTKYIGAINELLQ
ncbi:MAG: aminoglycoside phosphotransferase family protein [bacterium]|nr:aminoglycoside phosphotransferase family protein [bacterium]